MALACPHRHPRNNATLGTQQQNARMVRALAEAGSEQNEEVKKISAWRILFVFPLSVPIYGMNFYPCMPELHCAGAT